MKRANEGITMRITKYGHACLLVEQGKARLLIDPGAYSKGFEGLTGLNAILVTHQHGDHLAPVAVAALLEHNPQATVYADEGSVPVLAQAGVQARAVKPGDQFEVAGVSVEVAGGQHAVIHPDIPVIPNVGYLVAGTLFYPGDSFALPPRPVEVLAAPAGAPWLKVSELVDYVRAVKPKIAIPVHDAVLAMPEMHASLLERLTAGRGIEVRVVPNGQSTEIA